MPLPLSGKNIRAQKPRNIDVLAMKARRLLLSTDVGSHQATTQARVDGNESDKIYYAHGKRIDVIDLKGKNK
ncbi:GL10882 [Drosophila persimilis]|uniref:GL10882 n=1 Tax=Drosophila persimilis TaxID=7234 RepID=B4GDB0_DROPE|nr:GL10882 [Drosophila persimilis]